MLVDGGRIHSVVETAPACGVSVNCTNYALVPGRVRVLVAPPRPTGDLYTRALRDGAEMLNAGVTTVVGFVDDDESLEPVARAYGTLGLRTLFAVGEADYDSVAALAEELGLERIAPGRRADLAMRDPGGAVESVMIGGEWRMVNRRIKGVD